MGLDGAERHRRRAEDRRMSRAHDESRPSMLSAGAERTDVRPRPFSYGRLGRHVEGWLFASPWIIGFLVFTAGPMLFAAVMAFTSWDLLTAPRWVGRGARLISAAALRARARSVMVGASRRLAPTPHGRGGRTWRRHAPTERALPCRPPP
jgi:hypothetical protein